MDERRAGPARLSIRRRAWPDVPPGDRDRIDAIREEAFPPTERGAHDTVARRDGPWLWTAHSVDDRLIGFATALSLPTARAAYLEYLAVLSSARGSGAGAALLAAVADDLRAEPAVRGIALEVEDPARAPGHDPLPARRLAFYERWGARPVTSLRDYSMPDLAHPGGLVPMLLLWRGVRDDTAPGPDDVARVLTDLYRGYYADVAAEGHLEEMLKRIRPADASLSGAAFAAGNHAGAGTIGTVVQAGVVNGPITVHQAPARATTPNNLPFGVQRMIGRQAQLDRLDALAGAASGSRLCVLDGQPGIGKTTLAVWWGDTARDLFPDGQVYVDLRGFDPTREAVTPEAAARMILGALHVPPSSIPSDPDDRLALLRSTLDDRRLLLIIDNVRESEQVRPLLPRSRGCFTVVTARHRLYGLVVHHDAERVPLPPLSDEESVHLLEQRLGHHRVQAERAAVDRVVAACGGHPLALSVVAARAVDDPANSLATIVRALESKSEALDVLRLADAGDLRAVFSLSYDNLSPAMAEGFRILALFPGSAIDVASAAAMTGHDQFQARETLTELVRCHLLGRTTATHYSFHTLAHAYGLEMTRRHDAPGRRADVLVALLNHLLHAAHRADRLINDHRRQVALAPCLRPELLPVLAGRSDAMAWFTAEYDNLLAAIALATAEQLHPYTWQLAWTIPNYAYLTARLRDWIATCADAVAAAARLGERSVEVRLRQSLARALGESGDHAASIAEYTTALEALEELGDVPGRANALNGLADVRLRAGAFADAFDSASEALKLYAGLGDDAATAGTFRLLGRTCQALGDPVEARRHHGLAQQLYARSDNAYGLAHVADSMADLESTTGRDDLAEAHLRRAVALHYRAENLNYAARSCRRLRDLLLASDPGHPSTDLLSRAIAVLEDNRKSEAAPLIARIATP
ncbi:GNAT family N-acetyltransferase [Actinosynnema sp. NPDC004786]